MSWEEQFYLPRPVASYSPNEVAARVRRMVPASAAVSTRLGPGLLAIKVRFGVDHVEQLASRLGSSPQTWLDYEWRDELDPPRDETQQHYEIVVELVEMDHPELRVASSDADNREAWPLAFALAGCLAEEYDATEAPPASHAADELN